MVELLVIRVIFLFPVALSSSLLRTTSKQFVWNIWSLVGMERIPRDWTVWDRRVGSPRYYQHYRTELSVEFSPSLDSFLFPHLPTLAPIASHGFHLDFLKQDFSLHSKSLVFSWGQIRFQPLFTLEESIPQQTRMSHNFATQHKQSHTIRPSGRPMMSKELGPTTPS